MADIFISYAREDRDKAIALAKSLKARGLPVWGAWKIPAGEKFRKAISEALERAACVVVLWSSAAINSDWVLDEADEGRSRGILVPVIIEDILPPLGHRQVQAASFLNWGGEAKSTEFIKLLQDIESKINPSNTTKKIEYAKITQETVSYSHLNKMVRIRSGNFIYQDVKVKIEKPYLIDVYPVTNLQFRSFYEDDGYKKHKYWSTKGKKWLEESKAVAPYYWRDYKWNSPEHPVVGISYFEAEAYAKWAGKRLPTEKEWERAARGTDGRRYPWGKQFDIAKCNTSESKIGQTTPATNYQKGISAAGCYDMAGNVWEWTLEGVLRGGSWDSTWGYAECASSYRIALTSRFNNVGFRCVRSKKN